MLAVRAIAPLVWGGKGPSISKAELVAVARGDVPPNVDGVAVLTSFKTALTRLLLRKREGTPGAPRRRRWDPDCADPRPPGRRGTARFAGRRSRCPARGSR